MDGIVLTSDFAEIGKINQGTSGELQFLVMALPIYCNFHRLVTIFLSHLTIIR
jgi:hypothetical protein